MAINLQSSQEITNGLKLFRLIVDGGGEVCRNCLNEHYPTKPSLASAIANHRQNLEQLVLRKKVLPPEDLDKLFPPSGCDPDVESFDITLLIVLLRNVCNLQPPCQGWKDKPSPLDRSKLANLLRIKEFRNVIAHACKTGVSSQEFETRWNEISRVLVELGMDSSVIQHLKEAPLDKEHGLKLVRETQCRLQVSALLQEEERKLVEKVKQNSEKISGLVQNLPKEIKLDKINVKIDSSTLIGTKGPKGKRTSVYRGKLHLTGKDVAVKKMFSGIFEYEKALALKALQHPNVMRCFAVEKDDEFVYLALELCQKSLADCLEQDDFVNGALSRSVCLQQVTEAVKYLHSQGVCHRDIKPGNIFVIYGVDPSTRRFVLADVNVSKEEFNETFSSKTPVAGDIGWIPREVNQPTFRGCRPSWDIFSLGCVFYYILTNMKHPFGDASHMDECQKNIQCAKIADMRCEDFVEFPSLKNLLNNMVDHDPDQRPAIDEVYNVVMSECGFNGSCV